MCGIAGILNLNAPRNVPEAVLRQMLAMIRHRGPDEFGIYRDDRVNLGNARLSIVDLAGGQQPIANEDNSLWIVFNGEVFNHAQLRPELEAKGHRFRTHCDTEVVLHMYEEYGPACLNRLNGQWAIAIWDSRKNSLFLARDRLGVRPLFYTVQNDQLTFGSEIKCLLANPSVKTAIDPAAVSQVFTFWSVQGEGTAFAGIKTLLPGHWLLAQDGNLTIQPYWEMSFADPGDSARAPESYVEEFESLLVDATLLRLKADVPVGAYLSGGLDSSTTCALIKHHSRSPLKTFSIGFSDPDFDETAHQNSMVSSLGTEHYSLTCTQASIGQAFPEVIWHTETPLLRTSPVPMYLLAGLVRKHDLKVVITGEGADEFLGGYDIFKESLVRRFWAKNPDSAFRPHLLKTLYPEIPRLGGAGDAFLMAFFKKHLTETSNPYYSHLIRWSNGVRLNRLLAQPSTTAYPDLAAQLVNLPAAFAGWPALSQAQYLEIKTFMSPYLLSSQGDRPAMANSVEGRFPFLDYRLVEFCSKLPVQARLQGLDEKWLLRQVAKKYLPADIWGRRKRPYRAPIHRSFFHASAPEWVRDMISPDQLKSAGLFNPLAVEQLVKKASGDQPLGEVDEMAVAGVLSAQLLHHQYIATFADRLVTLTDRDNVKVIDKTTHKEAK